MVLPTGAGKTFVALGAINAVKRSTLVIALTIDLVSQWYSLLADLFGCDVGIMGAAITSSANRQ
ncbi:MAG: DEAD/DEAH box helicase family protein [Armatimonadota bacterium]